MLIILERLFHGLIAMLLSMFLTYTIISLAEKTPHTPVCERKVQWTSLTN